MYQKDLKSNLYRINLGVWIEEIKFPARNLDALKTLGALCPALKHASAVCAK